MMYCGVHEYGYVQIFGHRQDAVCSCSDGRRPKGTRHEIAWASGSILGAHMLHTLHL